METRKVGRNVRNRGFGRRDKELPRKSQSRTIHKFCRTTLEIFFDRGTNAEENER